MTRRDELAEAQAALIQKRRALGIAERGVPPERAPDLPASVSDSSPDEGPSFAELLQKSIAQIRERKETREHEATREPDRGGQAPRKRSARAGSRVAEPSFGKLFLHLVESPQFNALGARELRVLCAFVCFRDDASGTSSPGRRVLEEILGCSPRTVDRAIAGLLRAGVVRQEAEGHWRRTAKYRIAENGAEIAANLAAHSAPTLSGAQSRSHSAPALNGAQGGI